MLSIACSPAQETYTEGKRITIQVEITNVSQNEIEIPAVGIPWQHFYAMEFRVKNGRGFRKRLPVVSPRTLPPTRVPAGDSIRGEVDLGQYLVTPSGESIANRPGEYEIEATVKTFIPKRRGGEKMVRLRCGPFVVKIVSEKE